MAESAQWYVVQTYSGYENTVKATIEKTIENRQLQDVICEVAIPMETVTEVTDNLRAEAVSRLCAGQNGDEQRYLVHRPQHSRRHGLRRCQQHQSPSPD